MLQYYLPIRHICFFPQGTAEFGQGENLISPAEFSGKKPIERQGFALKYGVYCTRLRGKLDIQTFSSHKYSMLREMSICVFVF